MKTIYARPTIGRFLGNRDANVAILFALASSVLMLIAAFAVNFSYAASTRQKMQAALDAAVIAGATASSTLTQAQAITVATNYYSNDLPSIGAANPPSFNFNANGSLTGVANYTMPMIFGTVSGAGSLAITVTATAGAGSNPVCILLLSSTVSPGALGNGGMNVNAPTCEMDVKSTGNPAFTFNSGASATFKKICVQGTNELINGSAPANLSMGCSTATNPYVGKLPSPGSLTCMSGFTYGANYNGGSVSLSPGVYCGGINFNGPVNVNFAPGLYVIKNNPSGGNGTWNVNGGKWTCTACTGGAGLTFYFADTSEIQFNSAMDVTLNAPTTGTYAGILIYEADGLALSPFIFNDSVQETINGLIYLPSRNVTWNSTSNQTSKYMTLIANTGTFDTMNWSLAAEPLYPISNGGGGGSGSVRLTQ